MKTIITTVVCLLIMATTFAGEPKKESTEEFEISGYFMKGSNVSYEIYEVTTDSWELVEVGKGLKYYKVKLEINKTYVISFIKERECKLLFVDVQKKSYIDLDVDFNSIQDATLKYTQDMDEYEVKVIKK